MTVFERERAAFGLSGGYRVPAVGSILLERKLISCNQMLWITVFVSFYLATEATPKLFIQQHCTGFWKTSSDIFSLGRFHLLPFVAPEHSILLL